MTLPPGQRAIEGFPRFGTHFHLPPPPIPDEPALTIGGLVEEPFSVRLASLAHLPRTEIRADFHCVAGWSATGLVWEGVRLRDFFIDIIEPALEDDAVISHLVFTGLDAYRSTALVEDAFADDVLLAESLNGEPLDGDHGAPLRLVSPSQYGYVSTKHLCAIDVLDREPQQTFRATTTFAEVGLRLLGFNESSRSRVWHEERKGSPPNWLARPLYRLLIPPIARLAARGGGKRDSRDR